MGSGKDMEAGAVNSSRKQKSLEHWANLYQDSNRDSLGAGVLDCGVLTKGKWGLLKDWALKSSYIAQGESVNERAQ
jgi:hypothetical protein